jgi:thymidylate kinase
MRPNISNCHALPGKLIVFEGADGSGKTTQIKALKKLLEKEWHTVTVSSWKSAPIIGDFLAANESLKKVDERILPETSLFFQSADLLYRIEREVIPALKQNHIVIMDRGIHTLLVRGLIIGMTETQIREWLLWWRNTIYRELFDKAITIHITISQDESIKRIQKRALKEHTSKKSAEKKWEWTLLAMHFINSVIYAPDGKKMTRHDKKLFIHKTQAHIIDTYGYVFWQEKIPYIEINGTHVSIKEMSRTLQKRVVDMIM